MSQNIEPVPTLSTSNSQLSTSTVLSGVPDDSYIDGDHSSNSTDALPHLLATSSDRQLSPSSKREDMSSDLPFDPTSLGMTNHWRDAVDEEEELYFNRVGDAILKAIEPGCMTSQGSSHEYNPLAIQMALRGFGDGRRHPIGLDYVPAEYNQPEDDVVVEDLPCGQTNALPAQSFGYSTEDSYTGSGWDFYSYGPPYTPMYGWSSTSIPQDSVSRESRCCKLFRSFSVNAEKTLVASSSSCDQ
ncbi:hypothetical protein M405DRAFT_869493 [Rhizopogon salebrosus TDB-379]|nr:hypothetical protein M405DRAFT_869493 [Rhizopogon salebrosus TDB-379]